MRGVQNREESPNPLANKDPHRPIFASGYGLPGPYSLADLDRGVHCERDPNLLGHRLNDTLYRNKESVSSADQPASRWPDQFGLEVWEGVKCE